MNEIKLVDSIHIRIADNGFHVQFVAEEPLMDTFVTKHRSLVFMSADDLAMWLTEALTSK